MDVISQFATQAALEDCKPARLVFHFVRKISLAHGAAILAKQRLRSWEQAHRLPRRATCSGTAVEMTSTYLNGASTYCAKRRSVRPSLAPRVWKGSQTQGGKKAALSQLLESKRTPGWRNWQTHRT